MGKKYFSLVSILIVSPIVLWAIVLLLPTFDDWTYFTSPDYDYGGKFINRLLPRCSYWRPFDGLFGYLLSLDYKLFPALNHIAIYLAHLVSCMMIYLLAGQLRFSTLAKNTATLFFFLSPGVLGTVLAVDALNQAYSLMWGLAATYFYLSRTGNVKYWLWIGCTLLATLSKENGITFFVIPQLIALGFGKLTLRQASKDTLVAAACIVVYFVARWVLASDAVAVSDDYLDNSLQRKLKNIGVFVGMTFIPLDYICLYHAPNRNILVVVATLLLAIPFFAWLTYSQRQKLKAWALWALLGCVVIAVLPHLVTLFTAMHSYSSIGLMSLVVAFMVDKVKASKTFYSLFLLFVLSCTFIDCHHWLKSYESGLVGQKMGREAISKTATRADRVYIIGIDQGETKYSSFCVVPFDAFNERGKAAMYETGYEWPTDTEFECIDVADRLLTDSIADKAIERGFERVWLVHGDTVDVIR